MRSRRLCQQVGGIRDVSSGDVAGIPLVRASRVGTRRHLEHVARLVPADQVDAIEGGIVDRDGR